VAVSGCRPAAKELNTCVTRARRTPCQRARAAQIMIGEEKGAGNQ